MIDPARIRAVAEARFREHEVGAVYTPLTGDLALRTMDDAYAAMEALRDLWAEHGRGPVGGYKIALTSKPIQELCGVDQPCGGFVFARTIHRSPAEISLADYNGLALEFELAVRIGKVIPAAAAPFTAESVRDYVDVCFPAFELIDDRRADYSRLDAISMVSDNIWCGGVVLGPECADWREVDLATDPVALRWNGETVETSVTGAAMGNPMESLAFLANLAARRGWPMRPGDIVITGSTLATRRPVPGDRVAYTIDGIGTVEVSVRA